MRTALAAFFTLICAGAAAQGADGTIRYRPTADISAERDSTADASGLPALWRANRGGADIYLFGTMHVLPAGTIWRGEAFEAAMADAGTTFFETNADGPRAEREMGRLIERYGLSKSGPLSERLGADRWAQFSMRAEALGLAPATFEAYEPWLAILSLTLAALDETGFSSGEGVDDAIKTLAREEGDAVRYLEPLKTQVLALASLDAGDALANFDASLDDIADLETETEALLKAWRAGDVAKIEALALADLRADAPIAYQALFADRNEDWLRTIDRLLNAREDRDAFVAVGAGHMVGPDGLIERLRASGVEVERLQ